MIPRNRLPVLFGGRQVNKWWLTTGIDESKFVAVYQPKGAASQAASYKNLVSNQYDLTVGIAPTWSAAAGWTFDGTQYLRTGITPPANQTWSVLVQYANATFSAGAWNDLIGSYAAGAPADGFILQVSNQNNPTGRHGARSGSTSVSSTSILQTSGNFGIAGRITYWQGIADATLAAGTEAANHLELWVGGLNLDGVLAQTYIGEITSIVICNATLTAAEMRDLAALMYAQPERAAYGTDATTYAQLMALLPVQHKSTPILTWEGAAFEDTPLGWNILDPCMLIDPKDPARVLLYYGGGDVGFGGSIGRATASTGDMRTWTRDAENPIFGPGAPGAWDEDGVRLDNVIYNAATDEFWMYYTGYTGGGTPVTKIGLAKSPGNDGVNFTRYVGNPILSPIDPDTRAENSAVLRDDATHWYMYYCHRGDGGILPTIKLATSADGQTWVNDNTVVWSNGAAYTYYDDYLEWLCIVKLSDRYCLLASTYDAPLWTVGMATCATPDGTFTPEPDAIFRPAGKNWDRYAVSCGFLTKINNRWYLVHQAQDNIDATGDYTESEWDLGLSEL